MAIAEATFNGIAQQQIDCTHCTQNLKCKAMPRKFGIFLRDCIYLTESGFRCHLQEERNSREALVKDKVIRY